MTAKDRISLSLQRADNADERAFEEFVRSLDGVLTLTQISPNAKVPALRDLYVASVALGKEELVLSALRASPLVVEPGLCPVRRLM